MSQQQTAYMVNERASSIIASLMTGMSLDDLREALETPVPGECFPLAGHCGKPTGSPDVFWCDEHPNGGAK